MTMLELCLRPNEKQPEPGTIGWVRDSRKSQ